MTKHTTQLHTRSLITSTRVWEIDALRGLAIIAMIMYHLYFNLEYFYEVQFSELTLLIFDIIGWFARLTFVSLVGVTMWIRFVKNKQQLSTKFVAKTIKRSAIIGVAALLVTIITWFSYGESAVWFGVLHMIAVSILLASPLLRWPNLAGCIGLATSTIGFLYFPIAVPFNHFFIFGLAQPPRTDLDYFPLIPWFGVVLLGIFIASRVYKNDLSTKFPSISNQVLKKYLTTWGKYSLLIYLIHQPVLLYLLKVAMQ